MCTLLIHTIKFVGQAVNKDRVVSTGPSSLNGHDSSYIMSTNTTVFKVLNLSPKSTNKQLTDFPNLGGQNTTPFFLFGDSMK